MPSFDIVSQADTAEIGNAVLNMTREMTQRYDFKNAKCTITLEGAVLTLAADDDLKLRQMHELLHAHLARRSIEPTILDYKAPEKAAGQSLRQTAAIKQGINRDLGKKIVKLIKDSKLKLQTSIQGDQLRVTGKKRDDLQTAMDLVKDCEPGQPLQYVNFRD